MLDNDYLLNAPEPWVIMRTLLDLQGLDDKILLKIEDLRFNCCVLTINLYG